MKRKILLTFVLAASVTALQAQKSKPVSAFAITGPEKGHNNWNEVRLVNVLTGEEMQSIYTASQQPELLNARTGKAIVKKEIAPASAERMVTEGPTRVKTSGGNTVIVVRHQTRSIASDKPFATNSAACAFDKKHNRLYYTPMGIAQLRYIDMKSKTPKIYYFEEEAFGPLKSSREVAKQITRMVFASDGNGYALTNDAKHLIRFTTGKKPEITDLGTLTDAPANGANSIHRSSGYGGDMVADNRKNLYLITASRSVFRISLESKQAEFLGNIQGLPKGYTTNGAAVDEDNKIIVCSSNSTQGYYRFAPGDLKAEKFEGASVYNASDLANGNLLTIKKKKDKKEEKPVLDYIPDVVQEEAPDQPVAKPENSIGQTRAPQALSVYPNPVRTGAVKVSFAGQPAGRYQMQLIDLNGKVVSSRQVVIGSKSQVEEFRLPPVITAGSYLIKVTSEDGKVSMTGQVVVEK